MSYRNKLFFLVTLVLALALALPAQAQVPTPTATPVNPNANISWPPPVYVLRGEFTVRGAANLSNMQNYFLEFRQLNADLTAADEAVPWFPVTVPQTQAVQDDVLGVWDTSTVPDGLYELRLTINLTNNQQEQMVVSPLRVENTPPPFAVTPVVPVASPTATVDTQQLLPTPTQFDPTPRATARLAANVRRGDSVIYEAFTGLQPGQTVPIVGQSSLGTGWFLIELPNGARGWVSPSVVDVSGSLSGVPFVSPPPPPTPTPIPATPTPVSTVNLVAGNFRFDPPAPVCGQTFNIYLDVANFGTTPNPSGLIGVVDIPAPDPNLTTNTVGALPVIQPGQTVNIGPIPLTVNVHHSQVHQLVITIDPGNQILETNKFDNVINAQYTLLKGSCP